jgi:tetratricopeptide (TPR) repeat protein
MVLVGASIIYALMDRRKVTTSSEKAYQAYLKGEDLYYRLYRQEALKEFEEAARLDPNFAMAFARMAWLYSDFDLPNEYQEAKVRAFSLLDRVSDKEKIVINLGFARAEERRADVDRYTKELLDKYPDSFEAHDFLSTKYLTEWNYDKVIEENLAILKKEPNHAPSYNLLAYAYFYNGDHKKALEYIDKYTSLAPDQANPHDSHGELLLDMGRYDEALTQFRMADSIKPGLYFVVAHIGDTYAAQGMYRDAIGAYLKSREISPSARLKTNMDGNIAICYMLNGQPEKGVGILKEAITKVPDDLRCNGLLGAIYAEQGKMEDALVQLGIIKGIVARSMVSQDSANRSSGAILGPEYFLNGRIAMAKGDYPAAVESFGYLYKTSMVPDRMMYSALLGEALLRAGMEDSAITVLNAALKNNPNSHVCLRVLAMAYGQAGHKEAQKDILGRYLAVMKDADDGNPYVNQASADLERLNHRNL